MTELASQLRAGLFVAIGTILLLFSILFFGGTRAILTEYNEYKVRFESTQGLARGSAVSLSGMEVGNVKTIEFDDQGQPVATLNIESDYARLLNTQSIASIRTQGALGDKYVYITPSKEPGELLKENDFIRTSDRPDLIDMISGQITDLSVVTDTVKEFNALLRSINASDRSEKLIDTLIHASQGFGNIMGEPAVRESFVHLRNILRKIDNGQGTLGELVNESALHDRLMTLLGDSPRNQFLKPLLRETIKQNEKQR